MHGVYTIMVLCFAIIISVLVRECWNLYCLWTFYFCTAISDRTVISDKMRLLSLYPYGNINAHCVILRTYITCTSLNSTIILTSQIIYIHRNTMFKNLQRNDNKQSRNIEQASCKQYHVLARTCPKL